MRASTLRKYRLWIFGIFFVPLTFFVYVFYKIEISPFADFEFQMPIVKPSVKILLWNWRDEKVSSHWTAFEKTNVSLPNYLGKSYSKKCPFPCTITTDQSQLPYTDAVIFEAIPKNPNRVWDWLREGVKLPQRRPAQTWINFGYNPPSQFPILEQRGYSTLFDINMTYSQAVGSQNIPISLFCDWGGGNKEDFLKPVPSKSSDKIAIFVSDNCAIGGARNRTLYVKELMNYLKIDSYGKCLHNKDFPSDIQNALTEDHGEYMRKLIELISQYKFLIAFENSNLTDFVTEKLSLGFKAGTVPVYMGAPNVAEWLPGENSIINSNSFKNAEDLGNRLTSIAADNSQYSKFFDWKKKGLSRNFEDKLEKCVFENSECRLCQAVAKYLVRQRPNYLYSLDEDIILDKSYALSFDGSTSYVEIPDNYLLRVSESFTLSAWIFIEDEPSDRRIIDKNTAGTIDGFMLDLLNKNGRGFLRLCTAGSCWNGLKPLFANTWYHVSVVFVSTNAGERLKTRAGIFFYVNGVVDYEIPFDVPMFGLKQAKKNTLPLRIGRAAVGNNYWKGMIDDVAIWDVPLSQDRLRKLMFERLGGREHGLVGYWSFNEGDGTKTIDHTPSRLDATVYFARWVPSETKDLILNDCV